MKRKILPLILLSIFFVTYYVSAQNSPRVNATAAVLLDAKTGQVLYAKNPHQILAPASTTKIMTAILVLEHESLDKAVTVSKRSSLQEGSSMYLQNQEHRTIRDLLFGLLLVSGNDAASELAESLSGSEDRFTELMNQKAHQLGLKDTQFKNASGLPAKGHYSTAYDLALLTQYALKNSNFAYIVQQKVIKVPGSDPKKPRTLINHNKLLWRYPYTIGVKTGYTLQAGGCLVSAASYEGRQLVAVVLKTPTIYDDSIKLFKFGFGQNQVATKAGR